MVEVVEVDMVVWGLVASVFVPTVDTGNLTDSVNPVTVESVHAVEHPWHEHET